VIVRDAQLAARATTATGCRSNVTLRVTNSVAAPGVYCCRVAAGAGIIRSLALTHCRAQ